MSEEEIEIVARLLAAELAEEEDLVHHPYEHRPGRWLGIAEAVLTALDKHREGKGDVPEFYKAQMRRYSLPASQQGYEE